MEKHFSEQVEKAIEYLAVKYSPYAIYLFGSAARDELHTDSDIDIAFLSINQVNAVDCYESSQDLYEIFRRDVDLVNLSTASTVFSMQVIANGILVFCNDDTGRMRYEMVVYKSYALLNEGRSEILDMAGDAIISVQDDIVLNKIDTITRCIKRIHDVYEENSANLTDPTKQDSIILNLQRACEASIDLAMHIVAVKRLGLPQNSRDSFELLCRAGMITKDTTTRLKSMAGFRNIAIHDYQAIQMEIVVSIIEVHLQDFDLFIKEILAMPIA